MSFSKVSLGFNIPAEVQCSICWKDVVGNNQEGIAKLKCGHWFHLACIGSAFNAKGAMVCPCCRGVEDSVWILNFDPPRNQRTVDDESTDPSLGYGGDYNIRPPRLYEFLPASPDLLGLRLNRSSDGGSSSSSTASADPPPLGLNLRTDGGPLYE